MIDYSMIPHQAWSRIESAAEDRNHPMRLFSVATVGEDGSPRVRLLVLRGADRATSRLWFHTDRRSLKVAQLQARPQIGALAYDPRDGVQLRLRGEAALHEQDELAQQHWDQMMLTIRRLYSTLDSPGMPIVQRDPRTCAMVHALDMGQTGGFEHFAVVEMQVAEIDWLQVISHEQRRAQLRAQHDWALEPITP